MNEQLKLGLTLMVITVIAGLCLALANQYTFAHIEKQKQDAVKRSLNKVIQADSFDEKDDHYDAYDKGGKLVGEVLLVEAAGYSSTIKAMVGIGLNNKITGLEILEQQETPGLGARIEEPSFKQQFIGKSKDQLILKKDNGDIDAITGATISSRAVTDAVREMIAKHLVNISDNHVNTSDNHINSSENIPTPQTHHI